MSLFLKNGEQILNALDIVMEFGQVSGLILNVNKTEGIWIGSLSNCNIEIGGIKWPSYVRYLGVYIGHNKDECRALNWENKLDAFERLLDNWKTKHLTLHSKVNFLKTFALSKLVFSALMLPIPDGYVSKIEKLIYKFIWGKKDKIRRRSMICNFIDGTEMIDVERFFSTTKGQLDLLY